MSAQIFLVAPADADASAFPKSLAAVLASGPVSALLLQRGNQAENAYKSLVKAVAPLAQAEGCAVLVEGEPGWVKLLGADGLHVSGGPDEIKRAVAALKPSMIVGTGAVGSRHEAMIKGELDVDYIFFGPLSGSTQGADIEMAQWWAETMEIPSVISFPEAEHAAAGGNEFLALGESLWRAPDPAAAFAAVLARAG